MDIFDLNDNDCMQDLDEAKKAGNNKKDKPDLADGKEGKTKTIIEKAKKLIITALKNYAADKAGDLIDDLLLGHFREALIDVYSSKSLGMSEDDVQKAYEQLKNTPAYKRDKSNAELSNRKDDNKSTNIDEKSAMYDVMWYGGEADTNLAKTLSNFVAEFQKGVQQVQQQQEQMKQKLKSMHIEISDKELETFGPQLIDVVKTDDAEQINKKLEELKKTLHESYLKKFNNLKMNTLLTESKFILTEDQHYEMLYDTLLEQEDYRDAVLEQIFIDEGLKDKFSSIGQKLKQHLVNATGKTMNAMKKFALGPMIKMAGFAIHGLMGGWTGVIVLKLMYCLERDGKKISNCFERQWTKYANSKGIIARVTYLVDGDKNKKYSMRFYEKDLVWRIINVSDQLKHPDIEQAKQVVNGEFGEKFRKRIGDIWNPLFDQHKGGQIDWNAIFEQAKNVKINQKALQLFSRFADNYETIQQNCVESPKIDTRTQELKKKNSDVNIKNNA